MTTDTIFLTPQKFLTMEKFWDPVLPGSPLGCACTYMATASVVVMGLPMTHVGVRQGGRGFSGASLGCRWVIFTE